MTLDEIEERVARNDRAMTEFALNQLSRAELRAVTRSRSALGEILNELTSLCADCSASGMLTTERNVAHCPFCNGKGRVLK